MHKYIKRILFFLLLLLQLNFAYSFASVSSNKALSISSIEFSKKTITAFSEPSFKENHLFKHSFLEIISNPGIY